MFKCLTIIILLTKVCAASHTDLNEQMNSRIVNSYYSQPQLMPQQSLKLISVVSIYGKVPVEQEYTLPVNYNVVLKEDGGESLSSDLSSSNLSERAQSSPDDQPSMSYTILKICSKKLRQKEQVSRLSCKICLLELA